jgi:hypothetical protein
VNYSGSLGLYLGTQAAEQTGMGKHFSINIFGPRKHPTEGYKENCSYYLYRYFQSYENFALTYFHDFLRRKFLVKKKE